MKNLLDKPQLYHISQIAGGFFGARVKAFKDYIDFSRVKRVFDIGCGPGHIIQYIPRYVDYVGFDVEARYIDYANRIFGNRGRFVDRPFDGSAARTFGQPDLILMNGVLHHMDDETALAVLRAAADSLPRNGSFFALDGCYVPSQNPVSRYLISNDRGQFVRNAPNYKNLVAKAFPKVEVFIRNDLSWVPYTFAITIGRLDSEAV